MKITKLAVSTIVATSLTLTALPVQVNASGTTLSVQKLSEKAFNNRIQTVKKEYTKIPVNIRAGYYINPQKQTITIVIKNLTKNVKYKNAIIKKFGKQNLIFKNALYSEQGLAKAKKSVDNFMTNSGYYIAGAGTNIFENKVEILIVDTEKDAIKAAKAKFTSKAYEIIIITKDQAPVPH